MDELIIQNKQLRGEEEFKRPLKTSFHITQNISLGATLGHSLHQNIIEPPSNRYRSRLEQQITKIPDYCEEKQVIQSMSGVAKSYDSGQVCYTQETTGHLLIASNYQTYRDNSFQNEQPGNQIGQSKLVQQRVKTETSQKGPSVSNHNFQRELRKTQPKIQIKMDELSIQALSEVAQTQFSNTNLYLYREFFSQFSQQIQGMYKQVSSIMPDLDQNFPINNRFYQKSQNIQESIIWSQQNFVQLLRLFKNKNFIVARGIEQHILGSKNPQKLETEEQIFQTQTNKFLLKGYQLYKSGGLKDVRRKKATPTRVVQSSTQNNKIYNLLKDNSSLNLNSPNSNVNPDQKPNISFNKQQRQTHFTERRANLQQSCSTNNNNNNNQSSIYSQTPKLLPLSSLIKDFQQYQIGQKNMKNQANSSRMQQMNSSQMTDIKLVDLLSNDVSQQQNQQSDKLQKFPERQKDTSLTKNYLSQTQEIYRIKQAEIILNEKNHFNLVLSQNQTPLLNQLEFKYTKKADTPSNSKKINQKLLSKGLFELHQSTNKTPRNLLLFY